MITIRKNFIILTIVLLLFISHKTLYSSNGSKQSVTGKYQLSRYFYDIIVYYDSGKEGWAKYILTETGPFAHACEEYTGESLNNRRNTHEITIIGEDNVFFNDMRVGGKNELESINIDYNLNPTGNPALLFHEICHFWILGGAENTQWLSEGICSFLPVAMIESGYFSNNSINIEKIYSHWGLRTGIPSGVKDMPMIDDFRKEPGQFGFFYQKSFKIQYLIFKEIGMENFQRLIKEILAIDCCVDPLSLVDMLSKYKNIDWQSFLTGWVFKGSYSKYCINDIVEKRI